jgi:hypothetical protein
MHRFEYEFTKSYKDPVSKRPGIDFVLGPKIDQEIQKAFDRSQPCEFGKKIDSYQPELKNASPPGFQGQIIQLPL